MFEVFNLNWNEFINQEKQEAYYFELEKTLLEERAKYVILPEKDQVFRSLELCSYEKTKIIFLGQDPYHTKGVANGLAFSVSADAKIPPSLRNMFKELKMEYPNYNIPQTGVLDAWAEQGMLLLNTCLTVREKSPMSHHKIGWEIFTDHLITYLSTHKEKLCFVLLGNNAKQKKKLIDKRHTIIEAVHPSPLSANRGFFGSNIFQQIDCFMQENYGVKFNYDIAGDINVQ